MGTDRLLTVYDRGHFQRVNMPDGRSPGIVTAITEDIEQNIWVYVSDRERLLLRIHDLRVLDQFTASQIPRARVLAQDPQGGIWLGLFNGNLAHYRGARLEVIPLTHSSVDSPVMSIFVDGDNSVWAATRNGLFRWKEGRLQQLTARLGLPCDEILAIAEDSQKTLWLYANCGAFAISDSELERWWKMSDTTVRPRFVLDALDGAQPSATSFQPAVAKSRDGRLWFANDTLAQIIDPARLGKNALAPPVHIETLIADRKSYPIHANLQLPALTRDIEVDYTALSLVIPQRVRFRYKLDERDADWQDAGTRRQAFYNDLPPGSYHFRVTGSNNDGLWNEAGASLSFSIAPAWYQTLWFRLLCAVLFLASLSLFYRLRVRQIAAEMNTRFDERLAERTRLARDFHDTLLQTIQGSKMVADDALDGDADPIRMRSALGRLSTWLGRAMDEGRSALSSLRNSTIERNDLAEALRRAGEECQFQRPIEFALRVEGTGQDLHPIVRDEVYRLGYEAIRNACIHSEASQLTVELSYIKDLILRVRDNGKGIEPEVAASGKSGHFGLLGMYERASRVRGKFTIASSPGTGTDVELVVPRSFAFQEPHYTRQDRSGQLRRFFRSLLTSRKR